MAPRKVCFQALGWPRGPRAAMLDLPGLLHLNPCCGLRCEKKVGVGLGEEEKSGEKRRVKRVGNSSNHHTQSPFECLEHFELQQLLRSWHHLWGRARACFTDQETEVPGYLRGWGATKGDARQWDRGSGCSQLFWILLWQQLSSWYRSQPVPGTSRLRSWRRPPTALVSAGGGCGGLPGPQSCLQVWGSWERRRL